MDENNYIISLTRPKTHSWVVTTLSVKNIVMGSPVNHYRQKKVAGRNEKLFMHLYNVKWLTDPLKGINFNMFLVAKKVRPHLSIIDGFLGMEGNGPNSGTPVEHGIALAGFDMLAVDIITTQLMGINFDDVGYLSYLAWAEEGQSDLSKIKIIGSDIKHSIIPYKLPDSLEKILVWKKGLILDKK